MKTTLQLVFFVLLPFLSFSQQYDLQLGGYLLLNTNQVERFDQLSTFTLPIVGEENLFLEQVTQREFEQGFIFHNRGSFSVGIGRTDSISRKFSYRLGLDLYNQRYKRELAFNSISFDVISIDTVMTEMIPTIFGNDPCDITETPVSELMLSEEEQGLNYNVYHLGLSGELKYSLIDDVLDLGVGFSVRTPLFSNLSQRTITRTTREENGLTICNHELIDFEDKTGNYFRNLLLAGTISLDYKLWNDLIISVGLHHSFSDYHSYGELSPPPQFVSSFSPSITMREAFIRVRQML